MLTFFGIDTSDAGIDAELIANAQDECWTPEELARWFGEKYELTYVTVREDSGHDLRTEATVLGG